MKLPVEFEDYIGKEVFVVGYDGDLEVGDLDTFDCVEDLNEFLSSLNPFAEQNITVVHGVLTKAETIPEDIGRGVYLVVVSSIDADTGCIYEVLSGKQEKLIETIEEILEREKDGKVTIDDIYVLYGYEVSLGCTVNEDQIDETLLKISKRIADVANGMREKIMETGEIKHE